MNFNESRFRELLQGNIDREVKAVNEVIDKKDLSGAERQAELHWEYVGGVLHAHGAIPSSLIDICAHHYKTAVVHGWKHGAEAVNGKSKG